jgi:RecQ family ATP-dependent DNA helicase
VDSFLFGNPGSPGVETLENPFIHCPWNQATHKAGYAAQSIVSAVDDSRAFDAPKVRAAFQHRGGFSLRPPLSALAVSGLATGWKEFAGAVLAKIAQRGLPAPCSLEVERHILGEARENGILDFQETLEGGVYRFQYQPTQGFSGHLPALLTACLYPELLVDDSNLADLLDLYRNLGTAPEREWFDALLDQLQDARLGLFILPQRGMNSLLPDHPDDAQRVDFALEIPALLNPRSSLNYVFEIDDSRHCQPAQKVQDHTRDRHLTEAGWRVFRFLSRDCSCAAGTHSSLPAVSRFSPEQWRRGEGLRTVIQAIQAVIPDSLLDAARALRELPENQGRALRNLIALPIAEAQLLVATALHIQRHGNAYLAIRDRQRIGLAPVIEAINQTLEALARIYGWKPFGELSLDHDNPNIPVLDYFAYPSPEHWTSLRSGAGVLGPAAVLYRRVPRLLSAKPKALTTATPPETIESGLLYFLKQLFRKAAFREGQLAIIQRALTLHPVIGLLPTGAGKSLCYQLASLLQPGFTLVIDPIRSLMKDQETNLRALGIHRCKAIMSGNAQNPHALLKPLRLDHYWFVFIAPERLQRQKFRNALHQALSFYPMVFGVIDEAHCVSEWGHNFMPAYLSLGRRLREFCVHDGLQPSLLALTGTASRGVLTDIMKELGVSDPNAIIEPKSFDRGELVFKIIRTYNPNRHNDLAELLARIERRWRRNNPGKFLSGLVFTYFQSYSSVSVEKLAGFLRQRFGIDQVQGYSSRADNALDIQKQFKHDQIPILVCTHGFGMGIDKPNVRYVVHAMLPRSVEDYYQQAGRAGRDKGQAYCAILFSDDQPELAERLLDTTATSPEDIEKIIEQSHIHPDERGDVIRNLWFITKAFFGREKEKAILAHVIRQLRIDDGTDFAFFRLIAPAFPDDIVVPRADLKLVLEKSLYRLILLGVVSDYTLEGTVDNPRFRVQLNRIRNADIRQNLHAYLKQYLLESSLHEFLPAEVEDLSRSETARVCGEKLIDFMYEIVEKRRRTALRIMWEITRLGANLGSEKFREALLAFLEESAFTEPVMAIAETHRLEPEKWFELLDRIQGNDDLINLLGACRRQLQETPDHPGLLLMAGLCSLAGPRREPGERLLVGAYRELSKHRWPDDERVALAARTLRVGQKLFADAEIPILWAIVTGADSAALTRYCYEQAPPYSRAHQAATRALTQGILKLITPMPH